MAGDICAKENADLIATHTLFVREHNLLASLLKAHNGTMTDEEIYQRARRIDGAEMQRITYEEFLPALIGSHAPDPNAYSYEPTVNPTITSAFSTDFFRYGHSMQSSDMVLVNDDGAEIGLVSLRDSFFNVAVVQENPAVVSQLLLGLASQVAQENDVLVVDDLRNFLFGPPVSGGLDLAALDNQRGYDHGMLDFNAFRKSYGLEPYDGFLYLTSDPQLRSALTSIYGNIDTGDTELFQSDITPVVDLGAMALAEIIRLDTGITNIQKKVFFFLLQA